MPRPTKTPTESRRKSYPLRLSPAERERLTIVAAAQGQTPADFLRASFLTSVKPGTGEAAARSAFDGATLSLDPVALAALNRIGSNLNQLTRRVNSGDTLQPGEVPDVLDALMHALARIEALVFPSIEG